jgi:hypothetical protein
MSSAEDSQAPYSTSAASGQSTGTVRRVGETDSGIVPSTAITGNTFKAKKLMTLHRFCRII